MKNPIIDITLASNIIASLPNEFNSHDFIREFNHRHPDIYRSIIARYSLRSETVEKARQKAHQQIGRFLLDFRRGFMPRIDKVRTIRDGNSSCALWRKR